MMRGFIMGTALLSLAACQPPAITGSADSNVRALAVGMSYAQVNGIMGPTGTIPDLAGLKCYSWVYDETISPLYVHAQFQDGVLVMARDGKSAPCTNG